MKIITVPEPALRQKAQPIVRVDKKIARFLTDLKQTLIAKNDPPGVGLAANQVNKLWQAIAVMPVSERGKIVPVEILINPQITKHSRQQSLGAKPADPDLEGCLSIPRIYGPVARYNWIEVDYQVWDGQQLINAHQKFTDFAARIVQHELDHLQGILFTDHLLAQRREFYSILPGETELTPTTDFNLINFY